MTENKEPKKRRPKGDGAQAYQLPDGRWRAEVDLGTGADGKRKRRPVYGATRAEANRALRQALRDKEDGVLRAGGAVTLADWMEFWLDNIAKVRPTTYGGYKGYIRKWVRERPLGKKRLDKLQPEDFERAYQFMRTQGKAPARDGQPAVGVSETTITQLHRIIARSLKVAVQRRRLGVSPTSMMDAPRPADYDAKIITPAKAKELIRAAEADEDDGAMWMFLLAFGPRSGELLALADDRLDLRAETIVIDRALHRRTWQHGCAETGAPACGRTRGGNCPQRHSGGIYVGKPKSAAGSRGVALPAPLAAAFRRRLERRHQIRQEEGPRWRGFSSANGERLDLVFCQRDGSPLDPGVLREKWHAFLGTCGVDPRRVHDGRHTAATVLLLMGVDPRVVMEIMGWSQISMLKKYQHVLDEMKKDVATRMQATYWAEDDAPAPEPEPTPEPSPGPAAEIVSMADFRRRKLG